jgi:hypothetical protein
MHINIYMCVYGTKISLFYILLLPYNYNWRAKARPYTLVNKNIEQMGTGGQQRKRLPDSDP